jgi:hypothetical protein
MGKDFEDGPQQADPDPVLQSPVAGLIRRIAGAPDEGYLDLQEAFIDGSFAPAKQGGAALGFQSLHNHDQRAAETQTHLLARPARETPRRGHRRW